MTAEVTIVTDKVCRAGHERAIFILLYNNALTIMMYNWFIVIPVSTIAASAIFKTMIYISIYNMHAPFLVTRVAQWDT